MDEISHEHAFHYFAQLFGGHNINDATAIRCDICFIDGSKCNGGYALLEKEGTKASTLGRVTYCCSSCFVSFVEKTDEERKALEPQMNRYQKRALQVGVGTDPASYRKLDESETFKDNAINFRRMIDAEEWTSKVTVGEKKEDASTLDEEAKIKCRTCTNVLPRSKMKKCGACNLVWYCEKQCQKKDWTRHKEDCKKYSI